MNEPSTPWTISYDAEASDLLCGYSLFMKTCKSAGRSVRLLRWLAVVALVSVGFVSFQQRTFTPSLFGVSFGALFLIFVVPWQTRRQLKKAFNNLAAPNRTLPITVRCDQEQISFTLKSKSEAKFFWSGVLGVAEDNTTFLLIPAKGIFYYIPKRVLTTEILGNLRSMRPDIPRC